LEFKKIITIFANVKQINKIKYGKKLQDTLGFEVAEKVKANFQWLR